MTRRPSLACFLLLATLAAVAPLPAQTTSPAPAAPRAQDASYEYFGPGCQNFSWGREAKLIAHSRPRLGAPMHIEYSFRLDPIDWLRTFLVFGLSDRQMGSVSLPHFVGSIGSPFVAPCYILCSWDAVMVLNNRERHARFTIPNDPSLLGAVIYNQWWAHHSRSSGGPGILVWWQASNGGKMTIGL